MLYRPARMSKNKFSLKGKSVYSLGQRPRLMNRWAFSPQTVRIADTLQSVPTGCVYFVVYQLFVGTKCISSTTHKKQIFPEGEIDSSARKRYDSRTLSRVSLQ